MRTVVAGLITAALVVATLAIVSRTSYAGKIGLTPVS